MSVVGFDFGNSNCYIAVAKAGGIETVLNEFSDRVNPAVVGFNDRHRVTGTSAKNQLVMNFKSTVTHFKRFIGHKFNEPQLQHELQFLTNKCVQIEDGTVGFQVQYRGEERCYSAEQIYAMLLSQLKETAEINLQTKVTDCVISVPSYFTDHQRRSVLRCSQIAGLKCLKVINDTTAVALTYGLFKQDLPAPEEKPKNVAFVDLGHSSFQVCITAFNKGKIKVLSCASDPNLGGRDFDRKLQIYFAEEFLKKYKVDATKKPRAWLRLGTEVEKVKKQMSTNSTKLPINIECFMDDKDVSHHISRSEFEELCNEFYPRFEVSLNEAIDNSGLTKEEIDVVELVGGAVRMPAVKAVIEKVFGKGGSTTLNLDEAVARGAAIQCAMLSHTVKVRDIEVIDAASYPITISWDSVKPDEQLGEMEVFKKFNAYPFTKMLTFPHRVEPFKFNAYYDEKLQLPTSERAIGMFTVNVPPPSETTDTTKVKVKVRVRLDIHGCFTVSSASMVEALPKEEEKAEEPMEVQPPPTESAPDAMETEPKEGEESKEEDLKTEEGNVEKNEESKDAKKEEPKKKKKTTKTTELTVTNDLQVASQESLLKLIEIENDLKNQVKIEKLRDDARNLVEEYVYSMRDKIHSTYEENITEADREAFSKQLTATEDWLYEDGENASRQVYVDKLAELEKTGKPIVSRHQAHNELPAAFEKLGSALTHYKKIVDKYSAKDEQYIHIEEAEMKKVESKVNENYDWFNNKMQGMAKCAKNTDPIVLPSQIDSETKLLKDFCNPIVNKPKPKVEPPKEEPKAEDKPAETMETVDKPAENPTESSTTEPPAGSNLDMEVD